MVWVWATVVFDHVTRAVWLTWSFRRERWAKNLGAAAIRSAQPGCKLLSDTAW